MIGRRPETVPGVEPGRWRVVRSRASRHGLRWYVERRGCHGIVSFPTWREAQDYADRMARTREYVLPRQPLPLTLPGLEEDAPVVVTQDPEGECFFLTDEGDGEMVALYRHELRPLALALLALAEQEEHE
nr:MAG TPA: hypothetical protein [Caudoviricetes sp.]